MKDPGRAGLVLVVVVALSLYYLRTWPTVAAFVLAIDHCDLLFCDFVRHFLPMGSTLFQDKMPVAGYYYSAFFAVLLSLPAQFPPNVALWIWGALNVAGTAVLFAIPWREFVRGSAWRAGIYAFLFLTSMPLLHNFKWGQVSVFMVLTMIGSLELYRRGHRLSSGVVLAVGASIKYYPALCVVYYVLKREMRILSAFALTVLILAIGVPVAALGPSEWWHFEKAAIAALRAASASVAADPNSQYFPHVAMRLLEPFHLAGGGARLMLQAIDAAIVAANFGLLWRLTASERRHQTALCAAVLVLSTPFLLETSWPHYFVFLPFCAIVLLNEASAQTSGRGRVALASILLAVGLSSVFAFNAVAGWQVFSGLGFLLWSDSLLLAAAHLVGGFKTPARGGKGAESDGRGDDFRHELADREARRQPG